MAQYGEQIVTGLFIAAFLMSIVLHEVAHGWMARQCGDPTAELAGRLSLNPLKHIDPFFTILMPIVTYWTAGFLFGGAKPVPVNPYNFRNLERDDIKVSLAGVTVNFIIALVTGYSLHILVPGSIAYSLFARIAFVNLVLAFFNLIPVPPLDGSHLLRHFLAKVNRQMAEAYERIGMFGFLFIIVLLNFNLLPIRVAIGFVWRHVLLLPY